MAGRPRGVLISNSSGKANGYAIFNLQDRGTMFIAAGDLIYEGMIVGDHPANDLVVNATKAKHLTNIRAAGKDENIILTPPRKFTLERAIDYVDNDELVEVTPSHIRLRKLYLIEHERRRHAKNP